MSSKNLTLKRVLVSGGGLAGPAIATLLARDGVDVTVIEIADGVRPGGQAVDIRGAGCSVLSRMGLLDRARAMRLQQRGIADVDSQGRRRTEMTVEDFGGEGMISEIEILRGDLAQLLVDASVEAGASYVFSTMISSLDNGPDGVDVTLSDGTERTVALVLGADGPHSATRRLAFGPEDSFIHPIGGYMAWFYRTRVGNPGRLVPDVQRAGRTRRQPPAGARARRCQGVPVLRLRPAGLRPARPRGATPTP
jgi:2-polyprenyl-6-methoxyphenol hydroxylase-like FAD-dependent oxidoreductase